jgi:glycerol-3-phosphate dehydrogenase
MTAPSGAHTYDVFVIGGGINGCGIARDAAGRGFLVCLAELGDLAQGTSSGSTKLIHGGLRYLEHYRFGLVRKALIEREILWANAPHIIWPLRFVLPHHDRLRPRWLLRLGLFLYDNLGGRRLLQPTATLDLRRDPVGAALKPHFQAAFEYSDCWVDDARLVVLNARDAADRGAEIRTRTEVTGLVRENGGWRITLKPASGGEIAATARLVVNAAGPWVDRVLSRVAGAGEARNVRLVQGSHVVVPRLYDDPRCFIFQHADGRIVFAIPFEQAFTLIGTTDLDYVGDPGTVAITADEIDYLCGAAAAYFRRPVRRDDVVWSYSGVRPLFDDGATSAQEATRDYVLRQDGDARSGVLINVFGGKITTYRRLAEAVLCGVEAVLGARGPAWTRTARLPGGDFPPTGAEALREELKRAYPFLDAAFAARLVRTYGSRAAAVLGPARTLGDLGRHFGADLHETEIRYLVREEWARCADDILWRRTKRGLALSPAEATALDAFVATLTDGAAQRTADAGDVGR